MTSDSTPTRLRDERLPFKTLTLTFYDSLGTVPFTTTFYVRDNATSEQIQELIRCIVALSECELGRYKIDTKRFDMPDYRERVAQSTAIAGRKWRISYKDSYHTTKSHTIPGRNPETSYLQTRNMRGKYGYKPDTDHPKWQAFITIFQKICLSNKGREIKGEIEADYSDVKWPPKSTSKRS